MGIFSRLFKHDIQKTNPEIQFGRYIDIQKTDEKYKSWDKSIQLFESEKYLSSYTHFLDFLANDEKTNVDYQKSNGKIKFSLRQGSKIIHGESDFQFFKADAKIVQADMPDAELMRRLLEDNFDFKYCRYGIDDDNCICLKFETFVEDGSPHKLYQALKELATEADRKDDVLIQEYKNLHPVNHHQTRSVQPNELKFKYDFFIQTVQFAIEEVEQNKIDHLAYPGGMSFLILSTLYKIDYLIKPEGSIMEKINEIHEMYFHDNMISATDKNKEMLRSLNDFAAISYADFVKEIYEAISTFGTVLPEGHQRLVGIIDAQMIDYVWYYDHGHHTIAKSICDYIVGFSLYSFALPEVSKALLHLYYTIVENKYFTNLQYKEIYSTKNGSLNKTMIQAGIKSIVSHNENQYGRIHIDLSLLKYDDTSSFCMSYLQMVKCIKYPQI